MINNLLLKMGITSKSDFFQILKQFLKFGIVGLSNTIISMVVYYICIFFGMHYILSNTIAFVISVLNAYFWNSKIVFQNSKTSSKDNLISMTKVFLSYGFTFILSTVLLYVWVDWLGVTDILAPWLNLAITIPLNFILNKYWAFKS